MLMFATAGGPAAWCPATQSTPLMTRQVDPEPSQFMTRTGTTVADLATP